jgi:hypothetical protein
MKSLNNTALVEEASAAPQSIAVQSSTLRELFSVFRLPEKGAENTRLIEQTPVIRVAPVSVKVARRSVPSAQKT